MQMQTRDVVNYMQIQGQNKQILQTSHLDKSSKWPIFLINYNLTKIFLKKYKLIYVMSIIKFYLLGQWTSITKRGVFSWAGL